MAGFLTTAVPNWTGRAPVIGPPLGALVGLWVLGRMAMLFQTTLGPLASVIDSGFLIVFAAVLWREVLAGRNWRNLPVCLLVSLFAAANVAFHLNAGHAVSGIGERLAIGVACMLIALIGGRIIPSFTRNWMGQRHLSPKPAAASRFDLAVLGLTGAAAIAWAAWPQSRSAGAALLAAGLANGLRLARWCGWAAWREPLVWILHLGYLWLAIGLGLLGATRVTSAVPATAGVHALTAGAVGVMTLAVMTRATRGHSGRRLTADPLTVAVYAAINLAALVRVAAPFAGASQPMLLGVSAALWATAFGGFAVVYGAMLALPRRVAA
jgi:uncharacterized protein involved in response to NO